MRKQRITLEIVYDERIPDSVATVPSPDQWDWRSLLALTPAEEVRVVHGGPVTTVKKVA